MQYQVEIPGLEGRIAVVAAGLLHGPRLLLDGREAPPGPKRRQFHLARPDGGRVVAELHTPNPFDPVPRLTVDGAPFRVAEPLRWYQWVWAALPLSLALIGGLLGGVSGAVAAYANSRLFRSSLNPVAVYLVTGLVSLAAFAVYLLLAFLFLLLIG